MLDDDLPRALLETARSGFDVFCLMEEKGLLSPTDVVFLAEVLDTVRKKHFIDRYMNSRTPSGEAFKPIPGAMGGVNARAKDSLPSHKKLLGKLGDGLTPDNVHDMALFFHGGSSSIHLRDIESFKTAEKIFQKLQSSRMIQPGNYTVLYNVLEVLGRLDLCETIEEHCRNPGSGEATTPQTDTTSRLAHPIPVEDNSAVPYQHNPPSHLSTLGNPSSGPTTNSSMESRDGIRQPYVYSVGDRMVIPPGMLPSTASHSPTDPKITELEEDKQKLQEQLAVAVKQARVEHDKRVQELEQQLRQKNKEVEELRQQANRLNEVAQASRSLAYTMDKSPHGVAIVIVNEKFDKSHYDAKLDLTHREGAQHDRQLFRDTFTALNYKVETFANLTAVKLLELLDRVANEDHSNHDSFVLCLSTHGVADGVYGSDSLLVKWQEIDTLIKQSPTLKGKPKLLFLQSCRSPLVVKADGPNSPTAQEDADVFKVFASTPNQAAYISPYYGSWLAMSMKRHFTDPQLMYTHNLDTLMNFVSDEVATQVGTLVEGGSTTEVQQCVHREKTLTKAVYFFPPQTRTV